MGAQNPQISNPRFGFSPSRPIDETLTDGDPTSAAVLRPAGLQNAVVWGESSAVAGGEVSLIIEASNDGATWVLLSETSPTQLFSGPFQRQILNEAASGLVDLEHWRWIRIRTAVASGAPTWTIRVLVSGIARDCEKFLRGSRSDEIFGPRLGLTPAVAFSDKFTRPAGTLFANCQVEATGVVLDGLTRFDAELQGSPDGGTSYVTLGTVQITSNGVQTMTIDSDRFFTLGAYYDLRFSVRDVGGAGANTAYDRIQFYLTLDSCDWVVDDDGAGPGGGGLGDAFISVDFGAPGAEVGDTRTLAGQIYDSSGSPLAAAKKIELIVYDSTQSGDLDLASNATFSAVNTGSAVDGVGTNRVVLTADASGAFEVDVNDVAVETVFVSAVNARGPVPLSSPQLLVASGEAELEFT